MDNSKFQLIRLKEDYNILPFDCGDSDLNDFLFNDAKAYLSQLLAVTYLIENNHQTLAFFSVLNDKITIEDVGSKNKFTKYFKKIMPIGKQFNSFPAVKIGRLGVDKNLGGQGLGTQILDYLKWKFTFDNNRTGCKYITVDAYGKSLRFYEKNDFDYLTTYDEGKSTRIMYFDLSSLI